MKPRWGRLARSSWNRRTRLPRKRGDTPTGHRRVCAKSLFFSGLKGLCVNAGRGALVNQESVIVANCDGLAADNDLLGNQKLLAADILNLAGRLHGGSGHEY